MVGTFETGDKCIEEGIEGFDDVYIVQGWICHPSYEELELKPKGSAPIPILKKTLELKSLPTRLKYVCLGDNDDSSVVISSVLDEGQEKKLITLLKNDKEALGFWFKWN